jgi:hypothetical protein
MLKTEYNQFPHHDKKREGVFETVNDLETQNEKYLDLMGNKLSDIVILNQKNKRKIVDNGSKSSFFNFS